MNQVKLRQVFLMGVTRELPVRSRNEGCLGTRLLEELLAPVIIGVHAVGFQGAGEGVRWCKLKHHGARPFR